MEPSTSGQGAKRERDNLGWLASSATLPKKRKDIEGVSGTSILELQAQLYRTQEHVRLRREGAIDPSEKHVRQRTGFSLAEMMKGKNPGVEDRDRNDKLHVKTTADRMAECQAALERKAQLYNKLARGEVEDDEDKYEVDFLQKGYLADERGQVAGQAYDPDAGPIDTVELAIRSSGGMMTADMERERERRQWEQGEHARLAEDEQGAAKRQQRKEDIMAVAAQAREERERAQALRARKDEAEVRKRDRLKEAFLQQQLAKLAAAKQQRQAKQPAQQRQA